MPDLYQAGDSILLQAGFYAKAGADFTAKIADCPQSGYETDGFVQRSENVYLYDVNGNQTRDPNKGMDILYNYYNLPYQVTFDNGNQIQWLYDGTSIKLQKQTIGKRLDSLFTNGDTLIQLVDTTLLIQDYLSGGVEYQRDSLEAIYLIDARLVIDTNKLFIYQYYLADHLGNNRVVFRDSANMAKVVREEHNYPFGLSMRGAWENRKSTSSPILSYLYNNKELDTDFGLNWYHYGARMYDPAVGRFTGVDPISDRFAWVSTYNYAENEPVANIDLWGLQKAKPRDNFVPSSDRPRNYEKGYQAWVEANPNAEISQTLSERLYTAGTFLQSALPSAKIPFGKASGVVDDIARGAKSGDEIFEGFSKAEINVIKEAKNILDSDGLKALEEAASNGKFAEVTVGGRKIMVEPDFATDPTIRAMTFGDDFIFSPQVFKEGKAELTKTILHELHRLGFSEVVKTGSASATSATTSTRGAFEFAEEASKFILK